VCTGNLLNTGAENETHVCQTVYLLKELLAVIQKYEA